MVFLEWPSSISLTLGAAAGLPPQLPQAAVAISSNNLTDKERDTHWDSNNQSLELPAEPEEGHHSNDDKIHNCHSTMAIQSSSVSCSSSASSPTSTDSSSSSSSSENSPSSSTASPTHQPSASIAPPPTHVAHSANHLDFAVGCTPNGEMSLSPQALSSTGLPKSALGTSSAPAAPREFGPPFEDFADKEHTLESRQLSPPDSSHSPRSNVSAAMDVDMDVDTDAGYHDTLLETRSHQQANGAVSIGEAAITMSSPRAIKEHNSNDSALTYPFERIGASQEPYLANLPPAEPTGFSDRGLWSIPGTPNSAYAIPLVNQESLSISILKPRRHLKRRVTVEDALKSFVHIKSCEYKPKNLGMVNLADSYPCQCRVEEDDPESCPPCSDETCVNRRMNMECDPEECPGRHLCQNQRFQKRQYANVEVFKTENKGFGLRAVEEIPPGSFIMEYVGEVLPHLVFLQRVEKYALEGQKHFYFMSIDRNEIIDATRKGSLSRFMNHSCNPNCVTQKWVVNGRLRVGLFSRRRIRTGVELTFDYNFQRFGQKAQKCHCGERNCRGEIGAAKKGDMKGDIEFMSSDDEDYYDPSRSRRWKEGLEEYYQKLLDRRGFASKKDVTDHARRILTHVKTKRPRYLLRCLVAIHNTTEKKYLNYFVINHGMRALRECLLQFKSVPFMVIQILRAFQILPLKYRNKVTEEKHLEALESFHSDENEQVADLARAVTASWRELELLYTIPKRPPRKQEDEEGPEENGSMKRRANDVTEEEDSPSSKRQRLDEDQKGSFGESNGSHKAGHRYSRGPFNRFGNGNFGDRGRDYRRNKGDFRRGAGRGSFRHGYHKDRVGGSPRWNHYNTPSRHRQGDSYADGGSGAYDTPQRRWESDDWNQYPDRSHSRGRYATYSESYGGSSGWGIGGQDPYPPGDESWKTGDQISTQDPLPLQLPDGVELPRGWCLAKSQEESSFGRVYYYNDKGETSWEFPTKPSPSSSPVQLLSDAPSPSHPIAQGSSPPAPDAESSSARKKAPSDQSHAHHKRRHSSKGRGGSATGVTVERSPDRTSEKYLQWAESVRYLGDLATKVYPSCEKSMRSQIARAITDAMTKYRRELPLDDFKKLARELTHTCVMKEVRKRHEKGGLLKASHVTFPDESLVKMRTFAKKSIQRRIAQYKAQRAEASVSNGGLDVRPVQPAAVSAATVDGNATPFSQKGQAHNPGHHPPCPSAPALDCPQTQGVAGVAPPSDLLTPFNDIGNMGEAEHTELGEEAQGIGQVERVR